MITTCLAGREDLLDQHTEAQLKVCAATEGGTWLCVEGRERSSYPQYSEVASLSPGQPNESRFVAPSHPFHISCFVDFCKVFLYNE